MLDPHYQVVRTIATSSLGIEQSQCPPSGFAVHPSAAEYRHDLPAVAQTNPARIKWLHPGRSGEIEGAAGLEKEVAFLGEEGRQPGEVDHLLMHLDLGEIGIDGEVSREGRR